MKIAHLVAGAGGMVCGSCLHGNTLAAALRAAGEDVVLVPLYTPLRTDEVNVSLDRVAFGGINVHLQQRSALFRRTPRVLDRLLDRLLNRPKLLRWATRRGTGVRPEQLGELTVSVLRGEQGRQRKELEKLVRWLEDEIRPEIVHLNNALLAGMARELGRRLDVPVVCTLAGEDVFLEKLPEPHRRQARELLRQRCAEMAAMVAMNRYYADFMAECLAIPRERIHVIPPGLNLAGHATPQDTPRRRDTAGVARESVAIGFLARICPEKGLHHLAEALKLLHNDPELPPVRLQAAGYLDQADRPYLEAIEQGLAECGLADRFEYVGEPDRAAKIEFLQSLHVMSVPAVCPQSKGLSVLEAWANAVPVVLPDQGAFSEMVEDTGGGLLCEPQNPPALAAGLKRMIREPDFAAECGRRAQQAVHQRFHAEGMARRTIELYTAILSGR